MSELLNMAKMLIPGSGVLAASQALTDFISGSDKKTVDESTANKDAVAAPAPSPQKVAEPAQASPVDQPTPEPATTPPAPSIAAVGPTQPTTSPAVQTTAPSSTVTTSNVPAFEAAPPPFTGDLPEEFKAVPEKVALDRLADDVPTRLKQLRAAAESVYPDSPMMAQVAVTQAILESRLLGRPSSLAREHNNLFGIKGKGVALPTTEYTSDGSPYQINDSFRSNASIIDSFKQHRALLEKSRYRAAFGAKDVHEAFALIRQGGYATDPNYAALLSNVYNKNVSSVFGAPPVAADISATSAISTAASTSTGIKMGLVDRVGDTGPLDTKDAPRAPIGWSEYLSKNWASSKVQTQASHSNAILQAMQSQLDTVNTKTGAKYSLADILGARATESGSGPMGVLEKIGTWATGVTATDPDILMARYNKFIENNPSIAPMMAPGPRIKQEAGAILNKDLEAGQIANERSSWPQYLVGLGQSFGAMLTSLPEAATAIATAPIAAARAASIPVKMGVQAIGQGLSEIPVQVETQSRGVDLGVQGAGVAQGAANVALVAGGAAALQGVGSMAAKIFKKGGSAELAPAARAAGRPDLALATEQLDVIHHQNPAGDGLDGTLDFSKKLKVAEDAIENDTRINAVPDSYQLPEAQVGVTPQTKELYSQILREEFPQMADSIEQLHKHIDSEMEVTAPRTSKEEFKAMESPEAKDVRPPYFEERFIKDLEEHTLMNRDEALLARRKESTQALQEIQANRARLETVEPETPAKPVESVVASPEAPKPLEVGTEVPAVSATDTGNIPTPAPVKNVDQLRIDDYVAEIKSKPIEPVLPKAFKEHAERVADVTSQYDGLIAKAQEFTPERVAELEAEAKSSLTILNEIERHKGKISGVIESERSAAIKSGDLERVRDLDRVKSDIDDFIDPARSRPDEDIYIDPEDMFFPERSAPQDVAEGALTPGTVKAQDFATQQRDLESAMKILDGCITKFRG